MSAFEARPILCLWQGCTVTPKTLEELYAHLCVAHALLVARNCSHTHNLVCKWEHCGAEIASAGPAYGPAPLCAVELHLLGHSGHCPLVCCSSACQTPFRCSNTHERRIITVPPFLPSNAAPLLPSPSQHDLEPRTSRGPQKRPARVLEDVRHARRGIQTPSPSPPPPPRGLACQWQGCTGVCANPEQLLQHIIGVHVEAARRAAVQVPGAARMMLCMWRGCARGPFAMRGRYAEHFRGHLPKSYLPFRCLYCLRAFGTAFGLMVHTQGQHEEEAKARAAARAATLPECGRRSQTPTSHGPLKKLQTHEPIDIALGATAVEPRAHETSHVLTGRADVQGSSTVQGNMQGVHDAPGPNDDIEDEYDPELFEDSPEAAVQLRELEKNQPVRRIAAIEEYQDNRTQQQNPRNEVPATHSEDEEDWSLM